MTNPFKTWLQPGAGGFPLGTWLMSAAPSTAEALAWCGFDFLVVDMEHVPVEVPETTALLRALGGAPVEPLVRLSWSDKVLVKRMMDAGARSLMFPFIESAEGAREAVSYTRYPPRGVRGVAAIHRASRFGRRSDYLRTAGEETVVIAQLETPEAVERTAEIAAVDGVDSLFLGPGDLSAAMGRIGEVSHPEVQAMIRRAAELAHAAGKPIGIVGPNPDMVRRFRGYGYDWGAVASDLAMMTGRALDWVAELKGGTAEASAAPY